MQAFSADTFSLLKTLAADGSYETYAPIKDHLDEYVAEPFKHIFHQAITLLPPLITQRMETQHDVFGRIWLGGGATLHYWSALYPRGSRKQSDAQLLMFVSRHLLEFGFYIGHDGNEAGERFLANSDSYWRDFLDLSAEGLKQSGLVYGTRGSAGVNGAVFRCPCTLQEFVREPFKLRNRVSDGSAMLILDPSDVLTLNSADLSKAIAQTFINAFPFVLMATLGDPLSDIEEFWEQEESFRVCSTENPVLKAAMARHPNPSVVTRRAPSVRVLVERQREVEQRQEPGNPSDETTLPPDDPFGRFDPDLVTAETGQPSAFPTQCLPNPLAWMLWMASGIQTQSSCPI